MSLVKNKKPFKELTPYMKRMKVLRDAVMLIKAKKFIPSSGFVFSGMQFSHLDEGQLRPKLKSHLKDSSCQVCQRGALLCSLVLNDNSFKTRYLLNQSSFSSSLGTEHNSPIDSRLADVFSKEQIALMETAFERDYNQSFLGRDLYSKAVDFGLSYDFKEERSLAILNNAIANKGIFKP